MFGQPDDQQVAGSAAQAQNPSMLDNVSTQDLQGQSTSQPAPQPTQTAQPTSDPQTQTYAQQHPLTTDDPFVTQPAAPTTTDDSSPTQSASAPQPAPEPVTPTAEPSATPQPVEPSSPEVSEESSTQPAVTSPVDHERLAGMKQEAMSHLEPLVDHINGSPEETFKTTMMMIQANDNHTLLDKALEAAKNIEDDKARAEALLDIINEINYFSQAQSASQE
jgi:hypothetical protein